MKKILIIMMGGIGDMFFLIPAIRALRKAYPSSIFCFLLGPYGAEKIIEGSNLIDKEIIIEPEKYNGLIGEIKLIRELRKESFDLSIASTGSNPIKNGLLCYLAGIRHRLGEDIGQKGFFYNIKIPFNKDIHEIEGNMNLIQKLGIEAEDRKLLIFQSEKDKIFADNIFTLYNLERKFVVGMHPGSGIHQARFKRWPKERFAQLADRLSDNYNASIIIFGGPEEIGLAHQINNLMETNPLIMTGKTTLGQAAALIEKCNLFISNDSGLMHVACAVHTPTIGIHGPTNFKRTGPYSDSAVVIRKELECSPCYQRGKIKCTQIDCVNLITVDEVFEAIDNLLKKLNIIKIKNN